MDDVSPPIVRPRSVTFTLMGVFLLGVWNFGRALALSQQMGLLLDFAVQPDPRFRLTMALIWGFVFIGLGWMGRRKRPLTRKLLPLILVLYAGYELSLTILFAQTSLAQQAVWLNLSFYLFITLFISWALNRTAANNYFTSNAETVQKQAQEG